MVDSLEVENGATNGSSNGTTNGAKSSEPRDLRKELEIVAQSFTLQQLEKEYNTDCTKGIATPEQVIANREKWGANCLTPPVTVPKWKKFLLQFANFFSGLLAFGSILCFIGYAIDTEKDKVNLSLGWVLGFVVIMTACFSYYQEAQSDEIMAGFLKSIPRTAKVIRNGELLEVAPAELVVGDLVKIGDGDQVPADMRLTKANEIKVDNSSLTGESEPVDRGVELELDADGNKITLPREAANLVFFTTLIQTGSAYGIVVGTGDDTFVGQIAGLATEATEVDTPIRVEIKIFIKFISFVAITLGVLFFIIGMIIDPTVIKNIVFMIGIIVANVPEGLLATVTVSLALTAKRMYSKNVLVKNLESVETLGSVTCVASDKTGTLTQNRMTVQHCWFNGKVFSTPACKNIPALDNCFASADPNEEEPVYDKNDATFKMLHKIAALCNNAEFLSVDEDGNSINIADVTKPDFNLLDVPTSGDASESGILKCIHLLRDAAEFRQANAKRFEIKFNSTNKWQLSIHEDEDDKDNNLLVLKGAPERVLDMCSTILIDGKEVAIDDAWKAKYNAAYEGLGGKGERVLGFAYRKMKDHASDFEYTQKPEMNFKLDDLCFAGLFSLIDPPREGVPEAVKKAQEASVRIFMVTGDHAVTARAIALQVGIITQDKLDQGKAAVFTGVEISEWLQLPEEEKQAKWDYVLSFEQIVFSRVSPAHKLIIVEACQHAGEIVAVTGDGVNDSPALKKADIGIAMGIAGKDVSKEAAKMILLDDNFASIISGIQEGRLIFDNLKKSIAYTLTSNIPEIAPFICFICLNMPLPLSTALILCVDLGTDMVPAISLAWEEKESDIMSRPPRNAAVDRLVNRRLISFSYLQIGIMQAMAGFFTYMVVLNDYGYSPRILMNTGYQWEKQSLMCTVDDDGSPVSCGYGCNEPSNNELYKAAKENDAPYCTKGCKIPEMDGDVFNEATIEGFRGYDSSLGDDAEAAVCGRSCDLFTKNPDLFSEIEAEQMAVFCDDNASNGFESRTLITKSNPAPAGAFYYWNGRQQVYPNSEYQKNALFYAQTAYFISIIVVQWADLLIAKTRKLSIFDQGLKNKFMNYGLLFETVLGCMLIYIPFVQGIFFTRPIHIYHWLVAVPWSLLIFGYDEVRKFLIRRYPNGFLDSCTYW